MSARYRSFMRSRVVALAVALGGCNLFFIGGGDDSDDPKPTPANDASAASDARDGSSGVIGTSFCGAHLDALFCEDFDAPGASLATTWPEAKLKNGATLTLSNEKASSPPMSALAVTNPLAGEAQAEGGRKHFIDWSGARSTITFAMSVFIDVAPTQPKALGYIATIDFEAPGINKLATRFQLLPNGDGTVKFRLQSVIYPSGGDAQFSGTDLIVPTHKWTRIERVTNLGGPAPTETVTVDGGTPTVFKLDPRFVASESAAITLGFQYTDGPGDGYRAYFDDIVFDAR